MSQILFEHAGIPFTRSSANHTISKGRMWTEKKKPNSAYLTKLYYNLFNFGFFFLLRRPMYETKMRYSHLVYIHVRSWQWACQIKPTAVFSCHISYLLTMYPSKIPCTYLPRSLFVFIFPRCNIFFVHIMSFVLS